MFDEDNEGNESVQKVSSSCDDDPSSTQDEDSEEDAAESEPTTVSSKEETKENEETNDSWLATISFGPGRLYVCFDYAYTNRCLRRRKGLSVNFPTILKISGARPQGLRPGVGTADFDPEDSELLLDAVATMVGSTTTKPLSFREGIFRVGKEEVKICDVFMDTGALHKSYISSKLVEGNRDAGKECVSIIPYRSVARLADQVTKIETTEMVRGHLTFVSDNREKEYTGLVEAIVWEMPVMDFIVGLPDIFRNYVGLLTNLLQGATMYNIMEVTDMREGEIKLWSRGEVEESLEEESTPVPVAFGPDLSFMEADYESSRKEYFGLLGSHVGEHLSNYTDFFNLLRSDLAVDRHISGAKNTVADWLSRMHACLGLERAISLMSEYHGEVSCILDCMFGYGETAEDRADIFMPVEQEQKVWNHEEMFAEVHDGRPDEVIQQYKNDVECRHLVMGNVTRLNVTRLKLFVGTREEAYKVTLLDADQFVIYKTRHWREDPNKQSEMFFYTEFTDGDCVFLPYSGMIVWTYRTPVTTHVVACDYVEWRVRGRY
eukprot:gene36304-biopygen1517